MSCAGCGGIHAGRLGEILAGYRLVGVVGSGGMATVYDARHAGVSQGRVAIKVLHPCHQGDASLRARFSREARASARIHADEEQQNIIAVLADGIDERGAPYLVMRRLPGKTLKAWLAEHASHVPLAKAVDLMLDATAGLHSAHCLGIVHRDVKPSNLFVVQPGGTWEHCVLLDFGIAKLTEETAPDGITGSRGAPGTPEYMPLEQFFGSAEPACDVYALGAVLFELLAREPFHAPRRGRSPQGERNEGERFRRLGELRPDLPRGLAEAMRAMTAADPALRPPDASAAYSLLQAFSERHRRARLRPPAGTRAPESTAPTLGPDASGSLPVAAKSSKPARLVAVLGVALLPVASIAALARSGTGRSDTALGAVAPPSAVALPSTRTRERLVPESTLTNLQGTMTPLVAPAARAAPVHTRSPIRHAPRFVRKAEPGPPLAASIAPGSHERSRFVGIRDPGLE